VMGGVALIVVLGAVSIWVLADARSRMKLDRPVVATLGAVTIDKPEVWAALCLLVAVFFVPLYIVARSVD
jgi:hypothetical protein